MLLHEILFEAAAPYTSYGYWIDPVGKFIPVDYQGHDYDIRQLIYVGTDDAIQLGWIRLVTNSHGYGREKMNIELCFNTTTKQALSSVIHYISTQSPHEQFHIADREGGDVDQQKWAECDNRVKVIQCLRSGKIL